MLRLLEVVKNDKLSNSIPVVLFEIAEGFIV
jgi:hypothetical protein